MQWKRCCECSFWLKYTLFVINFIIWAGGLTSVVVGLCARLDNDHSDLLSQLPTLPALLLILIGLIASVIGFVGFLGAARESFCLLKTFCIISSVLFLCEIIGGVLMFTLMDRVHGMIQSNVYRAIVDYQRNERLQNFIDYVQQKLECCGASDYRDWDANTHFSCTGVSLSSKLHCSVPMSCCAVRDHAYCGLRMRPDGELSMESSVYSRGCTDLLLNVFKSRLIYISIVAFAVGISEVVGVVLANALMRDIVNNTISRSTEHDGLQTVALTTRTTHSNVDHRKADLL